MDSSRGRTLAVLAIAAVLIGGCSSKGEAKAPIAKSEQTLLSEVATRLCGPSVTRQDPAVYASAQLLTTLGHLRQEAREAGASLASVWSGLPDDHWVAECVGSGAGESPTTVVLDRNGRRSELGFKPDRAATSP